MLPSTLIHGLKFAARHDLTNKEMLVISEFIIKPYTNADLAELLGINKKTLYGFMQSLKLKNLLSLKDRDSDGNNLYQFNEEILV